MLIGGAAGVAGAALTAWAVAADDSHVVRTEETRYYLVPQITLPFLSPVLISAVCSDRQIRII